MSPLMANFDTSIGEDSHIYYAYNSTLFIAEWRNVYLRDNKKAGPFHFQIVWLKNGTIYFNYMNVPVSIKSISNDKHPVQVGLSDAYYVDQIVGSMFYF